MLSRTDALMAVLRRKEELTAQKTLKERKIWREMLLLGTWLAEWTMKELQKWWGMMMERHLGSVSLLGALKADWRAS